MASAERVRQEYGLKLVPVDDLRELDAIVLAVPHRAYLESLGKILARVKDGGVIIDVKSAIPSAAIPAGMTYWSL